MGRTYLYTLSFCCRKMNRQLQTRISKTFYEALENLGNFTFEPSKQPAKTVNSATREKVQNDFDFLDILSTMGILDRWTPPILG